MSLTLLDGFKIRSELFRLKTMYFIFIDEFFERQLQKISHLYIQLRTKAQSF